MFWFNIYIHIYGLFLTISFLHYLQGTRFTCIFINTPSNLRACLYYRWELKSCVDWSGCNVYVTGLALSGNPILLTGGTKENKESLVNIADVPDGIRTQIILNMK